MTIDVSAETHQLIERQMRQGGFQSTDQLVRAALASLADRDSLAPLADADVRALYPGVQEKIAQGLADAYAGRVTDGEAFFVELEREERELDARSAEPRTA